MSSGPLERKYGTYRITLRKIDHAHGRPTPHVEIWKSRSKIGNFDIASGRGLYKPQVNIPPKIVEAIEQYLKDPQVKQKIKEMIEASYFDLSKPVGQYGGIPKGFKVTISVEFTEKSLYRKGNN